MYLNPTESEITIDGVRGLELDNDDDENETPSPTLPVQSLPASFLSRIRNAYTTVMELYTGPRVIDPRKYSDKRLDAGWWEFIREVLQLPERNNWAVAQVEFWGGVVIGMFRSIVNRFVWLVSTTCFRNNKHFFFFKIDIKTNH